MSSYVVLARKWRPARFSDIVGQGHIVRTLMNAVQANRIHQAYLFTGSRGIGKTSIARIFAKVLRCENTRLVEGELGSPTPEKAGWLRSCDECANCREISAGSSIDVLEIDGASNNGVDAVREIRENARYLPASGARKIYIIDEVHMLTTAAFNALLKTLEEPPAHVIFIFATTEPHKIPPTILSRVQRFDYKRVTMAQIQDRLAVVTKAEGFEAEAGSLALIGRAAEGSMRDALSLLDQVVAFAGAKITVQSVRESVGLVEGQTLLGILAGVFHRQPLEALALVEQAFSRGHDLRVLARSLIEFLHAAILSKIGAPSSATLELSAEEWKELSAIAATRPLEEIEMIFQVMHHGLEWIARSPQPKIVLDVLLVKCATAEALVYADVAPPGQTTPSPAKATPAPTPVAPIISRTAPAPEAPRVVVAPTPAPMTAASPAKATPPPSAAPPSAERSWVGFIEQVRKSRPLLATLLEHGSCLTLPNQVAGDESLLQIAYPAKDSYYREQLQSRAYHEQLLALTKDYFGRVIRVQLESREETGESLADRKERELQERRTAAREAARTHPTIVEARALFGGELGSIEVEDELRSSSHVTEENERHG